MLRPQVLRTMRPWSQPPDEAELQARHIDKMAHWERHGFGQWYLRDAASGEFVGRGGPQYTEVLGEPAVELGWAIVPERWGQGLATELALTSVRVAFEDLGLERLVAFTLPDNLASRRVMEKAGFGYEGEFLHAGCCTCSTRCAGRQPAMSILCVIRIKSTGTSSSARRRRPGRAWSSAGGPGPASSAGRGDRDRC